VSERTSLRGKKRSVTLRRVMRTNVRACVTAGVLWAAALAGCSNPPPDPPPGLTCVTLDTNCQALHDPVTYSTIFSTTFHPTCAVTSCHAPPSPQAGLSFEDSAQAYQLLLGTMGGKARVLPDNPGCSLLAERILAKEPSLRMPPGAGLSDAQICDVVKWLVAGAPNN
jgi:cytochrome c551/c552